MRSLLYYACTIYKGSKQYVIFTHIRSIHYYHVIERNRLVELVWASGLNSSLQTKIVLLYYVQVKQQRGAQNAS